MKVVILCGGEGTRLREETEYKPKPMVTVGGLPILWHIMKIYSHFGFNEFVLCLGYRGEMIKQFFLSRELMSNDITIRLNDREHDIVHREKDDDDWTITFAETGLKSQTGSRIKRIEKYIGSDNFLATYGDAVSNIDIKDEIAFHRKKGALATLAGVHPHSKFGLVSAEKNGMVEKFVEKPVLYDYVNGGFYVFRRDIFDYLDADESCVLETGPFTALSEKRQLAMYRHEGFWHSMDTYKDYLELNKMCDEEKTPWKMWK
ncbi:TPA: glucose-1-phosphate cytidylyltransferase [Candidatus Micrarchaeota archaeon]|nr:glucose-1-phosphate cytidylyltransferase [Candidatus Micrarchaeota archaeon]